MKTIRIIVGILILWVSNSCSDNKSEIRDKVSDYLFISNEQLEANAMEIGAPITHEFITSLVLNGFVRSTPSSEYEINTFIAGFVKELKVNPGEYVKKGAVIAVLEHPDILQLQQNYAVALSRFSYLEKEYERMVSLQTNEVVAKKELNKVKAEFESAEAEYNSLHALVNLVGLSPSAISRGEMQAHLHICAKVSGWISKVNVRIGELVSGENPIATLIDESGLQIELEVFEKDYPKIKIGQEVFFTIQGIAEKMKAKVVRKGIKIDDLRKATIYAEFSDSLKNSEITFGSFVNAYIVQLNQSFYALPPSATVERGKGCYALRVVKKTTSGYELEEVFISGTKSSDGWLLVPDYDPNSNQQYLLKGVFDLLSEQQ